MCVGSAANAPTEQRVAERVVFRGRAIRVLRALDADVARIAHVTIGTRKRCAALEASPGGDLAGASTARPGRGATIDARVRRRLATPVGAAIGVTSTSDTAGRGCIAARAVARQAVGIFAALDARASRDRAVECFEHAVFVANACAERGRAVGRGARVASAFAADAAAIGGCEIGGGHAEADLSVARACDCRDDERAGDDDDARFHGWPASFLASSRA